LKTILEYIRSLPPNGREGAVDLAKYCIIVGLIFRSWISYTDGKEGCKELVDVVDEALQKRDTRIASLKQVDREKIGSIVRCEGRMLKLLALKLIQGRS
jgi:predicted type IV restriction endonuclease